MTSLATQDDLSEITVAIVDDDPLYLDFLRGVLGRAGINRVARIDASANEHSDVERLKADCVVIDYDLGRDNGFNLANRLRNEHTVPPALILVTGAGCERTAVKALRLGFDDYVSKRTLTPAELVHAISGAVGRRRKGSDADEAQAKLTSIPAGDDIDPSTGILSVAAIRDHLESMAANRGKPFWLMLVEAQHLPSVRSEFGLVVEARVRRELVTGLKGSVGAAAFLGHWSDGRLLVVSDARLTRNQLGARCDELCAKVRRDIVQDGYRVRVEARIGCLLRDGGVMSGEVLADAERTLRDAEACNAPWRVSAESAAVESQPNDAAAERRRDQRMKCLKTARIIPDGNMSTIDCVVCNQSRSGMKLRVTSYFVAPERFTVNVLGSGAPRRVRLRWQVGNEMGVQFEGEPA